MLEQNVTLKSTIAVNNILRMYYTVFLLPMYDSTCISFTAPPLTAEQKVSCENHPNGELFFINKAVLTCFTLTTAAKETLSSDMLPEKGAGVCLPPALILSSYAVICLKIQNGKSWHRVSALFRFSRKMLFRKILSRNFSFEFLNKVVFFFFGGNLILSCDSTWFKQ